MTRGGGVCYVFSVGLSSCMCASVYHARQEAEATYSSHQLDAVGGIHLLTSLLQVLVCA